MATPILIASLMRPQGETGVQTHVQVFYRWLMNSSRAAQIITPFEAPKWQIYPVFGPRRLLDRIHKEASVWWYRHWHAFFLEQILKKRLADGQPIIIYAQCPGSARAALRARTSTRQKVVMVMHFNLSQADEWADKGAISREGKMYRSIRTMESSVLPQLDGMVFVSDFMREELAKRIPAIRDVPAQTIPNFLADPGTPDSSANTADLITVGTLEYRKNQRYALEIVHAAKQLGRKLTLTIIGDGPERPILEDLARQLTIEDQVDFRGFLPNAAAQMTTHRACLHVSLMESFGIVLIEAMARGIPVFAPAVGGMPEVFDSEVEGRIIPLNDASEAARLILEWLDVPDAINSAGRAARQGFLQRFEANEVATRLVSFMDGVATT